MTDILDRPAAEERFRAVFSHLGAVAAYARRRGNRDADAVAAEVMTIAWRRLADVPEDDPRPWLYATARNLVLADARRSPFVTSSEAGEPVDAAPAPEVFELDPALGAALRSLSQPDREALLASTAFAVSRWIADDVVEPPVTKQEYLAAQAQLTLPPGAEWPTFDLAPLANSVTSRGAGGGRAVMIAMNAWECHWVQAIRRGDQAAERRAHGELNALLASNVYEAPPGAPEGWTPTPMPTTPFAVFAHDGGLDWVRATYQQAAAGDPRNLIQSCRANAPG